MRTPAEIASAFSNKTDLDGKTSFFLVGIGGAGMGAIARMLKHRGYNVSGTDSTESPETERLTKEGITVHIGHTGTHIQKTDALILTDAIDLTQSPEVARAKELKIPIVRRSQALGWILKGHKVIAVTGTHGKTTTTGMVAFGLIEAGLDPLVVAGASLVQLQGPVREGNGEWAVVEACEAYNGFHDLDPTIVVLTNLELDHVDFHGTYENLRASVLKFVDTAETLVYCAEDPGAAEVAEMANVPAVSYAADPRSAGSQPASGPQAHSLPSESGPKGRRILAKGEALETEPDSPPGLKARWKSGDSLDLATQPDPGGVTEISPGSLDPGLGTAMSSDPGGVAESGPKGRRILAKGEALELEPDSPPGLKARWKPGELAQKGAHNALNALGALTTCELIGADPEKAIKGIASFAGAERRQQVLLKEPYTVIDDYAHHPTEVRESLKAIRAGFVANAGSQGHAVPLENTFEARGATQSRREPRLIVVFQPHLYSRTAGLIQEFATALDEADEVVITDIYPAREAPIPGVSSARIAEKVTKPIHYVPSRHLLPIKVAQIAQKGDVVVGMGAGTISEFAPAFIQELEDKTETRKLRIAVLYGGDSPEREVSIHSGRAIHAALQRLGHDSQLVDMTDQLLKKGDLTPFTGPNRPDLAFLATHGTHAEDGAIQGLLELLHIPYTGSGIQASAIAMDKAMTKAILTQHGIRVPKGELLTEPEPPRDIQPPLIVKPNAQGSTVGLTFVETKNQLCPALINAFAYDDSVLVEEWVKGIELSVPVLNNQPLPPVEIAPDSGKYDFESKYTPGATNEIIPARITKEQHEEAQRIALMAHKALRCEGATRTDMILRGDEIFVLEVNTLPGMTGTSLLPNSAAAAGISFDQLCQTLIEDALKRHAQKG